MKSKLLPLILLSLALTLLGGCASLVDQSGLLNTVLAAFVPMGATQSLEITGTCIYGTVTIKAKNITRTAEEVTAKSLDVLVSSPASPVFHYTSKGFAPAAGKPEQLVTIKLPKS